MKTYYCRYHDFVFCETHKADCMGGERCFVADAPPAVAVVGGCSICCGVLKPKGAR